jgi:glutamate synthase (NADPH/NADH) small chain
LLIDKKTDFSQPELSFDEIDAGLTTKAAISEAKRCLNCKTPLCRKGCPIGNDIPGFIHALANGNIGEASAIIAQRSNLPAVCGRVCPHERQCEGACVLNRKECGIQIGKLERFIADFDAEMGIHIHKNELPVQGKVAVIGSGPAGLTVAGDLAKLGFLVTIFESQSEPGGVLMYGIPEFRLGKDIVRREIRRIQELGVEIRTNVLVGPDITVDTLFVEGFDAIFIGTGTALPKTLNLPGEELPGVVQAAYFLGMVALTRSGNLDIKEIPVAARDRVVIVGAGNVAMDAARTALRLGAETVTVVYRRTEKEITAERAEFEAARNEGVNFCWLASPVAICGKKKVSGLECEFQTLAADNQLQPTGQREILPADVVLLAIGQRPAARIVSTTQGIEVDGNGYVITRDRPYGMTMRRGVFAGGDVVHEPATVVLAMKEAKKVATGIAQYIEAKKIMESC